MPEPRPAPHVLNRDLPPGPRLVFVRNPGDDHRIVHRLAAVEGPGRLVVRPTPGGRTSDLALDILTATGRSPATLLADRTPAPEAWRQAAAWLATDPHDAAQRQALEDLVTAEMVVPGGIIDRFHDNVLYSLLGLSMSSPPTDTDSASPLS